MRRIVHSVTEMIKDLSETLPIPSAVMPDRSFAWTPTFFYIRRTGRTPNKEMTKL